MKKYDELLEIWRNKSEAAIEAALPVDNESAYKTIVEAMRYSLLAGGKRLRPLLVYATADALFGEVADEQSNVIRLSIGTDNCKAPSPRSLDQLAAAIEMIHTYSLIHDDLPCMDDDDLRRGHPTNHIVYGEAMAVLSGDALLNEAYALLFDISLREGVPGVRCGAKVASLAGKDGMIGGQVIDIESEGKTVDLPLLQELQRLKTGALLSAPLVATALLCSCPISLVNRFEKLGNLLGRCFQIQDDLLDITSDSETLGKTAGKDARDRKVTYVTLLGETKAREYLNKLTADTAAQIEVMAAEGLNMSFFATLNQELTKRRR